MNTRIHTCVYMGTPRDTTHTHMYTQARRPTSIGTCVRAHTEIQIQRTHTHTQYTHSYLHRISMAFEVSQHCT